MVDIKSVCSQGIKYPVKVLKGSVFKNDFPFTLSIFDLNLNAESALQGTLGFTNIGIEQLLRLFRFLFRWFGIQKSRNQLFRLPYGKLLLDHFARRSLKVLWKSSQR